MTESTTHDSEAKITLHLSPVALIRTALARHRVLAVRLIGPPGAGKTQLILETLKHLPHPRRVAVVVVNPAGGRDADRLHGAAGLVAHIDAPVPSAAAIWRVLSEIDLSKFDTVLIECAGGLMDLPDLGQDASVAVFSVSGGDDKAMEYSALLERVSAVVLTKIDLRPLVKFDSRIFRADVERINPGAALHEVSSLTGSGMFGWLGWLNERRTAKHTRDEKSLQEFCENFVG
jgi:hydrogenase nickel incorporation protein HypB